MHGAAAPCVGAADMPSDTPPLVCHVVIHQHLLLLLRHLSHCLLLQSLYNQRELLHKH